MHEKIRTILYFLLSLATFPYGNANEDVDLWTLSRCNKIEIKSVTLQLKRHLFCEYDYDVRPVQDHRNVTTVHFEIMPKFIAVNDDSNIVDVHCWTIISWNDSHLTWEPSQFNNLDTLHVTSIDLWKPDITMYNSVDENTEIPYTNCLVNNHGRVTCVPTNVYTTKCFRDYTWWPYDVQNCTIQFGSWSYSMEEIHFVTSANFLGGGNKLNVEWDIERIHTTTHIESSKFGKNLTSQSVAIHFILKRHYNALHAVYVSTIITLMIMTLTTLWVDPISAERMILANSNFICHLIFLEAFHWQVPGSAISSSMLLKFFEKSLGLACFTLISTSILRHLLELTTEIPTWVATKTSTIVKSKVGRILLISILDPKASAELETEAEDNDNLVSAKRNDVSWKHVVMLLSWINFLCVFSAYVIMLILYFPTESSGKFHDFNI